MPEEKSSTIEPTPPSKDPKSFEKTIAPRRKSKSAKEAPPPKTGAQGKRK